MLTDFCKILNVDDEEFEEVEGDADTLAGLLLEIKGDFPSIHEKSNIRIILLRFWVLRNAVSVGSKWWFIPVNNLLRLLRLIIIRKRVEIAIILTLFCFSRFFS